MADIIAITNQKGGVGKTTTCINLVCALSQLGARVLLCDVDPQGNSTSGMGIAKQAVMTGVYEVLIDPTYAASAIVHTPYGDLLPTNRALSGAGVELVTTEAREYRLSQALESLRPNYDFIVIDCPPSLEMLTLNALCAADSMIVPIQCEYFALEGLGDLMTTLRAIRHKLNPRLDIAGVLLTMYDGRTNLSMQVAAEVKKFFPGQVYHSVIPRSVRLSEAPSHGKPAVVYDRSSRGAVAYKDLAREVLTQYNKGRR